MMEQIRTILLQIIYPRMYRYAGQFLATAKGKYSGIWGQYSVILGKYSDILVKYSGIWGQYHCICGKYSVIMG